MNAGSDNWSENDDENQNHPLAILLHQATQPNDPVENLLSQAPQVPGQRISARLQGGTHQAMQSNDLIANLLSQTTQVSGQSISARLQGGTQSIDTSADVSRNNQNTTPKKCTKKKADSK